MRATRFKENDCVRILGTAPGLEQIAGSRGVVVGFALEAEEIDYGVLVEGDEWLCWQIPDSQVVASDERVFPPWHGQPREGHAEAQGRPAMSIAETPRLRFRRMLPEDTALVLCMLNDPSYIAYVADRGVRTAEDAVAYIATTVAPASREEGYGPYVMELRATGLAIGVCGLFKRPGYAHPDIGYATLPEHRGKGYVVEASQALLSHARTVLGLKGVSGYTSPDNPASIRILEKLGMSRVRVFQMPGYSGDTVEYFVGFE